MNSEHLRRQEEYNCVPYSDWHLRLHYHDNVEVRVIVEINDAKVPGFHVRYMIVDRPQTLHVSSSLRPLGLHSIDDGQWKRVH